MKQYLLHIFSNHRGLFSLIVVMIMAVIVVVGIKQSDKR